MAEAIPSDDFLLWKGTVVIQIDNIRTLVSNFGSKIFDVDSLTISSISDYAKKHLDWSYKITATSTPRSEECSVALKLKNIFEEDVIGNAVQIAGGYKTVTEMAMAGSKLSLLFQNLFSYTFNFNNPGPWERSASFTVTVWSKNTCGHANPTSKEAVPEFFLALPPSTTADDYMSKVFNNQDFSDVTILTIGCSFFAHKLVLGQSPVFSKMLQSPMQEGLSNVIEIKDVDPTVVELMLEFLYKRNPSIPDDKGQLVQILDLAERYDLLGLKQRCFEVMASTLSDENAAEFNVAAWRYSRDERVREHFKEYWRRRMQKIGQAEGSKQLIQDNWDAFF